MTRREITTAVGYIFLSGPPAHLPTQKSSFIDQRSFSFASLSLPSRGKGDAADWKPSPQLMIQISSQRLTTTDTQHECGISCSNSHAFARERRWLSFQQRPFIHPAVHRVRPEPWERRLLPGGDRRHRVRRSVHELDRGRRLQGALPGQRDRRAQ